MTVSEDKVYVFYGIRTFDSVTYCHRLNVKAPNGLEAEAEAKHLMDECFGPPFQVSSSPGEHPIHYGSISNYKTF